MRLRYRRVLAKRGRRWDAPIAAQQAPPDTSAPFFEIERRAVKMFRSKRGRRWDVVPTATVAPPPPAFVQAPLPRRRFLAARRRGRILLVPASADVVTARARARRPVAIPRRGRIADASFFSQPVVAAAPVYPPQGVKARLRRVILRRGRRFDPGWTQTAAVVAPAYPPQSVRARLRTPQRLRRRGQRFDPGWGQVVVAAPPAFVPKTIRGRLKRAFLRRGRRFEGYYVPVVVISADLPPLYFRASGVLSSEDAGNPSADPGGQVDSRQTDGLVSVPGGRMGVR